MVEEIVSSPPNPPSDFIDTHTKQAKALINSGKLKADDTRTIIYAEGFEQSEQGCAQDY